VNADLQRVLDAPLTADRQRFDTDAGRLVGGRCGSCGTVTWPARPVCPRCTGTDITSTLLPEEGTLLTWSRVWVPVEGIEPPYILGLVELGSTNIFGHVVAPDEDLPAGARVSVVLDESRRPPYWFEPAAP
jgi:uncharacterized OB-fold protein